MKELGPDTAPWKIPGELVELQLPCSHRLQELSLPGVWNPVHAGFPRQRFAHSEAVSKLPM
eukprot:7378841-Prymnesium_polylepis.1